VEIFISDVGNQKFGGIFISFHDDSGEMGVFKRGFIGGFFGLRDRNGFNFSIFADGSFKSAFELIVFFFFFVDSQVFD